MMRAKAMMSDNVFFMVRVILKLNMGQKYKFFVFIQENFRFGNSHQQNHTYLLYGVISCLHK